MEDVTLRFGQSAITWRLKYSLGSKKEFPGKRIKERFGRLGNQSRASFVSRGIFIGKWVNGPELKPTPALPLDEPLFHLFVGDHRRSSAQQPCGFSTPSFPSTFFPCASPRFARLSAKSPQFPGLFCPAATHSCNLAFHVPLAHRMKSP